MQLSQQLFAKAAGVSLDIAAKWTAPVNSALAEFGIVKPLDVAMFIAQIGHESGGFKASVESFNYSVQGLMTTFVKVRVPRLTEAQARMWGRQNGEASVPLDRQQRIANTVYGNRMGNTAEMDGWNFRGRGPMQTTGKNNYTTTGTAIGIDLIANPDQLKDPVVGARAAAHFFTANGCLKFTDNIVECTRIINGGQNGLDDRKARYAVAKQALTA
jgi:putative chitinase